MGTAGALDDTDPTQADENSTQFVLSAGDGSFEQHGANILSLVA